VPRKDQLAKIAPVIIDMGCFARVETNGGAFEQVNLMAGENPNDAVRAFCKPFNEVGIKTHMLDRGLNALRMYPVPADVRKLMYKVKHAQGVDIPRIFCGLNDVRNIIPSIKWAAEAGMTPQASLCITNSPVHTVEYYSAIADQLIEAGAPEICLKDMACIGQPAMLGALTRSIKEKHPDVIIQYHGHSGPGLSMASILEVCNNGADIIDTAIEPMSWGKVHPDIISVQSMLKNAGFDVPEINMEAYMEARKLTQEEMALQLGISITAYRDLEKGSTSILNSNVYRIADLLDTPTEEIVLGYRPTQAEGATLQEMQQEYSGKVETLERRILDLEKLVASHEETIRSKNEIISMLKKRLGEVE
jgi:pyruvate carboxylase subunit B